MLTLTQEQITGFEKWKNNYRTQIRLMKVLIERQKEDDTKLASTQLETAEKHMDDLYVDRLHLKYKKGAHPNDKIDISTEFLLGFYLSEYWNKVAIDEKDSAIAEILQQNKNELIDVFGGTEEQ